MEKVIGAIVGGVALLFLIAAIFGFVTQWAWNETMPAIFGLPSITLVQGIALNLLGGALFKSTSFSNRSN